MHIKLTTNSLKTNFLTIPETPKTYYFLHGKQRTKKNKNRAKCSSYQIANIRNQRLRESVWRGILAPKLCG